MSYTIPSDLWPPQRRGLEQTIELILKGLDVCYYGPTGSGKTRVAIELFQWALDRGWGGCFYTNRRLLIAQTADKFTAARLPFAVRAAGYDDCYDHTAPFQICSADTEASRVYKRRTWPLHYAKLIIVDELHLQKSDVMARILADQRDRGARVVGLTATPIGLAGWVDRLVISGTMEEYQACNALVKAEVHGITEPDMRKVERNKTGEYILDGQRRMIYTQTIVGEVIEAWQQFNPEAKPTLLYAPDVAGSRWFTTKFREAGVNWCHVDANEVMLDGNRYTRSRRVWAEILERFVAGDIKGLSSRFVLREGIDVPSAYHCILATPIGSLASYIQTAGRILRYSPETPNRVMMTDHGGNYHRHGSVNESRPWDVLWDLPEHAVSRFRENEIRERKVAEPIRCPECKGERLSGSKCPHCGFQHELSEREVRMLDGKLVPCVVGNMIRPRHHAMKHNTAHLWARMWHGWSRSQRPSMQTRTFNQMAAWFLKKHGYYPPRDLPFMPKQEAHWYRAVRDVPRDMLIAA